jgi:hypothetical protein
MSKHKHDGVHYRIIVLVALGYFLGNRRLMRAISANDIVLLPIPCKVVECEVLALFTPDTLTD